VKEGTSSFLKKRTKKLLSVAGGAGGSRLREMSKSFASFFQKRRFFLRGKL
jgi:hypothetical protein